MDYDILKNPFSHILTFDIPNLYQISTDIYKMFDVILFLDQMLFIGNPIMLFLKNRFTTNWLDIRPYFYLILLFLLDMFRNMLYVI